MKVSVCVLAYNQVNYIRQCLNGILMQQTTFPFEIILGEDESNDGTREICIDYANKHPVLIKLFLRSRKDVIYIKGRATGRYNFIENLKACRGKYIALCEGDDYWTDPLKLQKQVDFLESNSTVNICFHKTQILKNGTFSDQRTIDDFKEVPFKYIELLKNHNFIATASVMFRVPLNFKLPEWFKWIPFGDMALYKLISEKKNLFCLGESMAVYRVHEKGIYSGINRQLARQLYIQFYKIIFPTLTRLEKKEVKVKIIVIRDEIIKLRFPNNWLYQKLYYFYLLLINELNRF